MRRHGVTLLESMGLAVVLAFVAGAIYVAANPGWTPPKRMTAERHASSIGTEVALYRHEHPGKCPTVQQVKLQHQPIDPWGNTYEVECTSTGTKVFSDGPDKQSNTEDDVIVRVE